VSSEAADGAVRAQFGMRPPGHLCQFWRLCWFGNRRTQAPSGSIAAQYDELIMTYGRLGHRHLATQVR